MEVYRLIDVQHAGLILDGTSAALTGGRWNPRGRAVLYTSCNVSLAILELLSHYHRPFAGSRYCVATIRIPDAAITRFDRDRLPCRWRHLPNLTRQEGCRWLDSAASVALIVPSAIHAHDDNVLIDPTHARFSEVELLSCAPLHVADTIARMTDEDEDPRTELSPAQAAEPRNRPPPQARRPARGAPAPPTEQIPQLPDCSCW